MLRELVGRATGRRGGEPPASTGPTPTIAILGAGFGGVAMGIRLKQVGIESFTIYEKSDGVGGTWRDNSYPGAACDAPSHLYSYSFAPKSDWTRSFAPRDEILEYIEECTDRFGIRPHLRCNTEIVDARFDDDDQQWHLHTAGGEEIVADVVVSGLGQLNRPAYPDIPGLEEFEGTAFHSARWHHEHDLAGERVGVIGNAASAVQFVPQIAPQVEELTVFQRSANYVLPKPDGVYSDRTKWALANVPGVAGALRALHYWNFEWHWSWFKRPSRGAAWLEKAAATYRKSQIADDELRAKLTPDYPVGCTRILISNDFYPALQRENVEVETNPIVRATARGLVTADGTEHELDTIVFATGFTTLDFLAPLTITGREGRSLRDAWSDGAEAYLGITVSGFPNLFLLYGPNTNLGHNSIIFMIECQIHYILGCLGQEQREGVAYLDVRPEAQASFNQGIQEAVHRTVWESGCRSWYKTASGKVTNNWPRSTVVYWLRTLAPERADFAPGPSVDRRLRRPQPQVSSTSP